MDYNKLLVSLGAEQVKMSVERSSLIDLIAITNNTIKKQNYQKRVQELDTKIQENRNKMIRLYKGENK